MGDGRDELEATAARKVISELKPPQSRRGEMATSKASPGDRAEMLVEEDMGALVIFTCRHLFHRACLHQMQETVKGESEPDPGGRHLDCPLCPDEA